jgi:hypothetical protein
MRLGNAALRALAAIAAAAIALCAVGCTATSAHPATPVPSLPPDPPTGSALLTIAAAFNHDYDAGDYGPVYARWDARSQAIITRADYISGIKTARPVRPRCPTPRASARAARRGRGWCITRSAVSS